MKHIKLFESFSNESIIDELKLIAENTIFSIHVIDDELVLCLDDDYIMDFFMKEGYYNQLVSLISEINKPAPEDSKEYVRYDIFKNRQKEEVRNLVAFSGIVNKITVELNKFKRLTSDLKIQVDSNRKGFYAYQNIHNYLCKKKRDQLIVAIISINFFDFYKENTFSELPAASGAPYFGIGGVNYGYAQSRNTMSKKDTQFVFSELSNRFYDNDEIKTLFLKYQNWCRINQEEPIVAKIEDLTSSSLDEIISKIDS